MHSIELVDRAGIGKGLDRVLSEAWDTWNYYETPNPYFDTPGFGWLSRAMGYFTQIDDRLDGAFAPIYDTEMDLKAIRMASWLLNEEVPVAKAVRNRLTDYTIASGFDWDITHEDEKLGEYLSSVVNRFMENIDWQDLEGEAFEREVVDGEFLAEIIQSEGELSLEVLESDNLSEPVSPQQIEDWLGIYDFVPSWSFGVLTAEHRHTPKGYHVVRNQSGSDWEYVRESRFVHWKRNVPRNAKRGAPDSYTTHKWLGNGNKVLTATSYGAAIQASIAYIVEHAPGTNKTQAANLANARNNIVVTPDPITGANKRNKYIQPGEIIDIKSGQKYHAGLLGSNNSSVYIDVMEALFRLSGTPYAMPEHFMTGYAGNNNMASSETAESPWIQGRSRDQAVRSRRLKKLIIKVLRAAAPYLSKLRGKDFDKDVLPGLNVTTNTPDIVSRDIAALTESLVKQAEKGWISNRQAVQELGRDYDEVKEQIEEEQKEAAERDAELGAVNGVDPQTGQPLQPGQREAQQQQQNIVPDDMQEHLVGKHDQKKHSRGKRSAGSQVGQSTSKSPPKQTLMPKSKSELAKSAHVYVGKEIQRYSEEKNEPLLAKKLKGKRLDDNEPPDVVVGKHGIELKTMTVGANRKITMKNDAMERKRVWEKENKGVFHTVVFDDSKVFNAKGAGKHDETKRKIFYRRGYGSFRVDGMYEVRDYGELAQLLDMRANKLPKGAK